jgi:hypothetical protein
MLLIEQRDEERCRQCGGKCCLIYLDPDKGGSRDMQCWFEDWVDQFHEDQESYGVSPLFDPLEVHMTGNEHMRDELLQKGINPDACQYLGGDGCIIPWKNRPVHCTSYVCDPWFTQLYGVSVTHKIRME